VKGWSGLYLKKEITLGTVCVTFVKVSLPHNLCV
jgi:hypothetical protein